VCVPCDCVVSQRSGCLLNLFIFPFAHGQVAACTCGVTWLCLSWYTRGQPSIVAVLNGIVAGLAGVTPASGTPVGEHFPLSWACGCLIVCVRAVMRYVVFVVNPVVLRVYKV
jgi:ammonia channel protein AmtB